MRRFLSVCAHSYGSVPQRFPNGERRTTKDRHLFERAIKCMSCLYATPSTLVLVQKRMPPQLQGPGTVTYDQSGWCTVEQSLSRLAACKFLEVNAFELGTGWVRPSALPQRSGVIVQCALSTCHQEVLVRRVP